jgi:hypothetical protein
MPSSCFRAWPKNSHHKISSLSYEVSFVKLATYTLYKKLKSWNMGVIDGLASILESFAFVMMIMI